VCSVLSARPETLSHARRVVVSLGPCRTRSIAERKCAEEIERMGVNSTQSLIELTSTITFNSKQNYG
jgi:hypothetical protein